MASGNVTFDVQTQDGRVLKRYSDRLIPKGDSLVTNEECEETQPESSVVSEPVNSEVSLSKSNVCERRYPEREHRPPDRYQCT